MQKSLYRTHEPTQRLGILNFAFSVQPVYRYRRRVASLTRYIAYYAQA